jgi:hypothetical protein
MIITLRLMALICALVCGGNTRAIDTLRPDQLHRGMKGYGLSVFQGTTPERFQVEILGVLKNTFPKQDMILIQLSGANLEKHKTIAGMSGSPIYIDGKLIGALAYGWTFENDPLAGVTPIQNMLAEINRPAPTSAPTALAPRAASWLKPRGLAGFGPNDEPDAAAAPRALMTPLSLGGFSPRLAGVLGQTFERLGLLPVLSGGGSGGELKPWRGPIEPGGSYGVQLIRGDLNATAVGTATYVEKNRILAFGHPFFQAGSLRAPAVMAEVHTIMSSVQRSFKLATPVAEVGSLVGDWQSCIVGDTSVTASMLPVNVAVANRDTGQTQTYAMEIIDNQVYSPLLLQLAIAEAIVATSSSARDTTIRVALNATLSDRTLEISDTFFNPSGGLFDMAALEPLVAIFNSPFGPAPVKRVDAKVEATETRQTAEIKRAYFPTAEVHRGQTVPLSVVLKPYGQPEVTRTINIVVPASTPQMRLLSVAVLAGSDAPPDVAPPDNLDDYIAAIEKRHHATDLVALVQAPTQGMQYHGKLLKQLPPSALGVLDDSSMANVTPAADIKQLIAPTDWVLSGQATVRVPIRNDEP